MADGSVEQCPLETDLRDDTADAGSAGECPKVCSPSVADCLAKVRVKVDDALAASQDARASSRQVRLVAVSKLKPAELVAEAYEAGHRHFGENYVQELVEKAAALPADIEWHFIGLLQSNKVSALVKGCPSLSCVETVASEKIALALNKAWSATARDRRLNVMIQVNSSGEESKNGVTADECVELAKVIDSQCEALNLTGLMTIGAPDYSGCRTEDFELLRRCREDVAQRVGRPIESLGLSMGMSNDFERAILEGSTSVRVGSSIFGARPPKVA